MLLGERAAEKVGKTIGQSQSERPQHCFGFDFKLELRSAASSSRSKMLLFVAGRLSQHGVL